ncbi:MAG: hypothetical protein JSR37_00350 [Verrucomicrobia bacterium]|nr:hypothetical protein [Verrucomicrobiota bacterium]MBS0636856.1 hypothetical protein [Verrucomicrobiota bacterium]
MKFTSIFALFLLLGSLCMAQNPYGDFKMEDAQFSYNSGFTDVTFYNYHTLKITAEQNTTDNQLLVVVFPEREGVTFTISSVQMGDSSQNNLPGPVATVSGTMAVQINQPQPLMVPMSIPVQISQVSQYTVGPQEALMQGLKFYQMATGQQS